MCRLASAPTAMVAAVRARITVRSNPALPASISAVSSTMASAWVGDGGSTTCFQQCVMLGIIKQNKSRATLCRKPIRLHPNFNLNSSRDCQLLLIRVMAYHGAGVRCYFSRNAYTLHGTAKKSLIMKVNLNGQSRWWIRIQSSIHRRNLPQRQSCAKEFR